MSVKQDVEDKTIEQTPLQRSGHLREVLQALVLALGCGLFLKLFVVEAYHIPTRSMEDALFAGDYVLVNKFVYGPRTPHAIPFTSIPLPSFRIPGFSRPTTGDVMVIELPNSEPGEHSGEVVKLVKRCIAGPGATVEIREGTIRVNGEALLHHTGEYNDVIHRTGSSPCADYGPVLVPAAGSRVVLSKDNLDTWRALVEGEGHRVMGTADGSIAIDGVPATEYHVRKNYFFVLGDNLQNSLDSRTFGFVPEDLITGKALLVYWSSNELSRGSGLLDRFASVRWSRIATIVR